MRQIKRTVVMFLGGAALLAGLGLLTLLGLAAVVIPAIVGILAIELARATRCAGRVPALLWRTNRATKDQAV
jgi:hypothetical protein